MFTVRIEGIGEDVEVYYTNARPIVDALGAQPAISFVAHNGNHPGAMMTVAVARVITVTEDSRRALNRG